MNDPNVNFMSSLRSVDSKSPVRRSSLSVSNWYSPHAVEKSQEAIASASQRVRGVDVSAFREQSSRSMTAPAGSPVPTSPQRRTKSVYSVTAPTATSQNQETAQVSTYKPVHSYRASVWDPPVSCQRRLLPSSEYQCYFPIELTDRDYFNRFLALIVRAVSSLDFDFLRSKTDKSSTAELVGPTRDFLNLIVANCSTNGQIVTAQKYTLLCAQSPQVLQCVTDSAQSFVSMRDRFLGHVSGWDFGTVQSLERLVEASKAFISLTRDFSTSRSNLINVKTECEKLLHEVQDLSSQHRIHQQFQTQRLHELGWEKPAVDQAQTINQQAPGTPTRSVRSALAQSNSLQDSEEVSSLLRQLEDCRQRAETECLAFVAAARLQLVVRLLVIVQELQLLCRDASEDSDYGEAQRLRTLCAAVDTSVTRDDRCALDDATALTQQFSVLSMELLHASAKLKMHMDFLRAEQAERASKQAEELHERMARVTNRCSLLLSHDDILDKIRRESTAFITSDWLFGTEYRDDGVNLASLIVQSGSQDILSSVEFWPELSLLSKNQPHKRLGYSQAQLQNHHHDAQALLTIADINGVDDYDPSILPIDGMQSYSQRMVQAWKSFEDLKHQLDALLTPVAVAHSELLCRLIGMRMNLLQFAEMSTHRGHAAEKERLLRLAVVLDESVDADEEDYLPDEDGPLGRGKKRIDGIWQLCGQVSIAIDELHRFKQRARAQSDFTAAQAFEAMQVDLEHQMQAVNATSREFSLLDVDIDAAALDAMDVGERLAREGTEFITSDYLFAFACGPRAHSVGSLAIVAGAGALLRFMKSSWPGLTALGNGLEFGQSSTRRASIYGSSASGRNGSGDSSRKKSTRMSMSLYNGENSTGVLANTAIDFRDPNALRLIGFDAHTLRCAGFSDVDILTAGFTAEQLRTAGFTAESIFRAAGLTSTASSLQASSVDLDTLIQILHACYVKTGGNQWRKQENWKDLSTLIHALFSATQENGSTLQKRHLLGQALRRLKGVTLNPETNEIERLAVTQNNLSGQIPVEISSLLTLKHLVLSENMLTGEIPLELGTLINLEVLCLDHNHLEGEIPRSFKNLQQLTVLRLEYNDLSGLLPSSLANLSKLRRLDVSHNRLSGSLPVKFGSGLPRMQELLLNNNQFTGEIPSSWINMSNLAHLELQNNQLGGSLPMNYQKWTKLTGLNIQHNPSLAVDRHHLQRSLPKCRIKM